eukprot:6453877-Pyramimonas_sp.AAC.1
MRMKGYPIQPRAQAAYLGAELSCGTRQARATTTQRRLRHRNTHAKIVRVARVTKRYHVTPRLAIQ